MKTTSLVLLLVSVMMKEYLLLAAAAATSWFQGQPTPQEAESMALLFTRAL